MVTILIIGLGINISRTGELKIRSRYNCVGYLITRGILVLILYFGGFWSVFNL
jgi:hypothetical protein